MEAPLHLTSIPPRSVTFQTECYMWINRPATILAQHPALAPCSYKKRTILAFHMAYVFLNSYVTLSISSATLQCQRTGRMCQKTPHASFYPARGFLKAQTLLDLGRQSKCFPKTCSATGESPSEAKGSIQPLLTAGFQIKHWSFSWQIHRAPIHHSFLPCSKRQVKNNSPEPGNSLLLK